MHFPVFCNAIFKSLRGDLFRSCEKSKELKTKQNRTSRRKWIRIFLRRTVYFSWNWSWINIEVKGKSWKKVKIKRSDEIFQWIPEWKNKDVTFSDFFRENNVMKLPKTEISSKQIQSLKGKVRENIVKPDFENSVKIRTGNILELPNTQFFRETSKRTCYEQRNFCES